MTISGSFAQLVERDRRAREAVAGRADEHHLVPEERLERHRALPPGRADDAELELAAGDELDDALRVVHRERDRQLRVVLLELAEEERDHVRAGPRGRADLEATAQRALVLGGDLFEQLLLEREQPLRPVVEAQARLRGDDPPARAVEELLADPLLERPHLLADRRLRDPEPHRRLREALPLDDRAECRQLPCVHQIYLYRSTCPISQPPVYSGRDEARPSPALLVSPGGIRAPLSWRPPGGLRPSLPPGAPRFRG